MCQVEDCDEDKILARGLCGRHYQWARRHRFPEDIPCGLLKPRPSKDDREVPEWEAGLVTHTPAGTIVLHGGSGMGYRSYGCRCRACKEANRDRCERDRVKRMQRGIPETVKHGKATTYGNWGCRCDPCTEAWTNKCNTYYAKVLSAEARLKAETEAYEAGLRKGPRPTAKRKLRREA